MDWTKYGYSNPPTTCPTPIGYKPVPVGKLIERQDCIWSPVFGFWIVVLPHEVGEIIGPLYRPVCRFASLVNEEAAQKQDKWACHHKRMPTDTQCPVCKAFGRRPVTT